MNEIQNYQEWTRTVWNNDHTPEDQMTHALFGLATEVAEIIDPFKKERYTPHRNVSVDRDNMVEEIGDVLYYLVRVADMQGISLKEAMDVNYQKLENRYGNSSE